MFLKLIALLQLAHKILESLKGTEREWLVNLLYAFNSGNINKFDDLKKFWGQQVDICLALFTFRQCCLFKVLIFRAKDTIQFMSNHHQLLKQRKKSTESYTGS